jgi:membrane protease YdiL (CAAX protease family)
VKGRYELFVIVVAYALVRAFWLLADDGGRLMGTALAQALLKSALWIPACAIFLILVHRASPRPIWNELGLDRGLWIGVSVGALATLPMAIAIAVAGLRPAGLPELIAVVAIDPIAESVLFSGFLFSQLRRGWPLASALAGSAFLFGLAHVNGQELELAGSLYRMTLGRGDPYFWLQLRWLMLGVAAVGAGGLLLTWLFHRWRTLWPTIAFHGAINFWWTLSADRPIDDRTVGNLVTITGIGHGLAMATAIVVTLAVTRRMRLEAPQSGGAYDFTRTV